MTELEQGGERDLANWAKKWGLDKDWVITAAEFTLTIWRDDPLLERDVFQFHAPEEHDWPPEFFPLDWDPVNERSENFRARVEAHIERRAAAAEKSGRKRVSRKIALHFEWLVRYHLDHSKRPIRFAHLAREAAKSQDPETIDQKAMEISRTISALAVLIDLDLRPPKTGRPSQKP